MFSENPARLHFQITGFFVKAKQEHDAEVELTGNTGQLDEQKTESEGQDELCI